MSKLVAAFSTFVMEEACDDYSVSFRDGDPRETFFDSFNAIFDSKPSFCEMLDVLMIKISEISP